MRDHKGVEKVSGLRILGTDVNKKLLGAAAQADGISCFRCGWLVFDVGAASGKSLEDNSTCILLCATAGDNVVRRRVTFAEGV